MAANVAVTCMACRVHLVGWDAKREHYRTDLHRFNLQRKVAGLSALTGEEFDLRNEIARKEEAMRIVDKSPRYCELCSKKFSSERALANHVASRRHIDKMRATARDSNLGETFQTARALLSPVESDEEVEEVVGEDSLTLQEEMEIDERIAEAVPFPANQCAFDGFYSINAEDNVAYMARNFGFFLPMVENLADLTGLLEYVGQKVGIGYACVECDHAFSSVPAVQKHMIDKQHCRMTSDNEHWFDEYAQFYDFSDSETDDPQDGWEEVQGDEAREIDSALNDMSKQVTRTSMLEEGSSAQDHEDPEKEEVAMVLGDKVIGHRSLNRYYRQRGHHVDSRDAVLSNRLAIEYRRLGVDKKLLDDSAIRAKRMATLQRKKKLLDVGLKNNYTRKAKLTVPLATFNSGYRP